MTATDQLWQLDAAELVQGYRTGRFTPVDATEACLARANACEPALNAMVALDNTGALAAAQASARRYAQGAALGPLDGVPISIKDNMHVAGLPTGWGSRLLRHVVPTQDEIPVAALRATGAVITGKTTLSEFAMQGFTSTLATGTTRNPWNTALTPGGSSGGAVASVAAGYTPLALGTDGGGSTRRPASHCGLVGFKPSTGLVPRGGGLPEIFLGYEVTGSIARNVADAIALTEVLAGHAITEAVPEKARILFVPGFADHPVDPGITARVHHAAEHLAGMGHEVEEIGHADFAERLNPIWMRLYAIGLAWMIDNPACWSALGYPEGEKPDMTLCMAAAQENYRSGAAAGGGALFEILIEIEALKRKLDGLFARYDALLMPATAALPWPAEESHPPIIDGRPAGPRGHAIFTGFVNAAGLPAIALPWGEVDDLPTGFQLIAPAGRDGWLLALSREIERSAPAFAGAVSPLMRSFS